MKYALILIIALSSTHVFAKRFGHAEGTITVTRSEVFLGETVIVSKPIKIGFSDATDLDDKYCIVIIDDIESDCGEGALVHYSKSHLQVSLMGWISLSNISDHLNLDPNDIRERDWTWLAYNSSLYKDGSQRHRHSKQLHSVTDPGVSFHVEIKLANIVDELY